MDVPRRSTWLAPVVLALALSPPATRAEDARELGWTDLVPASLLEVHREAAELSARVEALSPEQVAAFRTVAIAQTARQRVDSGLMAEDELSERERRAIAERPEERFPGVVALWEEVERTRTRLTERSAAVEPALDGMRVRIPGYALPLDFEGTEIREFLLVPYVGACIHTPPPPPNQIVFVTPDRPFESQGLFSPVWIEGEISASGGQHELYFVDGQAPVDVGYSVQKATVEPYATR